MTARGRNKQAKLNIESPKDLFPTPELLCKAAIQELKKAGLVDASFGPALEPSCGPGNWIAALRACGYVPPIVGVELSEEARPRATFGGDTRIVMGDFLNISRESLLGSENHPGFGFIVGNPPFSLTSEFIKRCLELLAPDGVLAFVLRIGYFTTEFEKDGVTPRRDWLWGSAIHDSSSLYAVMAQPRRMYMLLPRPSFNLKGTDSATYVLAVWVRPYNQNEAQAKPTLLLPLVWRERGVSVTQAAKEKREAREKKLRELQGELPFSDKQSE